MFLSHESRPEMSVKGSHWKLTRRDFRVCLKFVYWSTPNVTVKHFSRCRIKAICLQTGNNVLHSLGRCPVGCSPNPATPILFWTVVWTPSLHLLYAEAYEACSELVLKAIRRLFEGYLKAIWRLSCSTSLVHWHQFGTSLVVHVGAYSVYFIGTSQHLWRRTRVWCIIWE